MKIETAILASATVTLLSISASASAAVSFAQTLAAAPTYGTTLNFDEPGTPTGLVSGTTWLASKGVTITDGVNGNNTVVDNFTNIYPWVGTGNSVAGSYGNIIMFTGDITNFSCQEWDSNGPNSPTGGGFVFWALDANGNVIDGVGLSGAWGGVGKTWLNMNAAASDHVRGIYISSNSWIGDPAYIDNLSWNAVPAPGGIALLALGFAGARRRRA